MKKDNNETQIRELLSVYTVEKPDEKRKNETVNLAYRAYLKQRAASPCRLSEQLKIQLTYTPRIFKAISLVYVFIVLCISFGEKSEIGLIAAAAAPILVTLTAPMFQRNLYGDMRELEASCKYNTRRLYAGSMLLGGIYNMAVILVSMAIFSVVSGEPFFRNYLLSLFFFCTSSAVSLIISARFNSWMGNMFGVFYSAVSIGAIAAYSEQFLGFFADIPTFALVLGGIASALCVLLAFKHDISKINKGESKHEIRA